MSLPTGRLVPALLGFNLGVELGQLAVVVVVWPLLRLVAQRLGDAADRLVAEALSAAIFGLGLYWSWCAASPRPSECAAVGPVGGLPGGPRPGRPQAAGAFASSAAHGLPMRPVEQCTG